MSFLQIKLRPWKILSRVGVTYRRVLDWMIGFYKHLKHTSQNCRQYSAIADLHFIVHRCTCIRVLRLHQSYPGNGFITVTLQLQTTREVLWSQSNSFLAIILQLSIMKIRLNSIPLLPSSMQADVPKLDYSSEHFFITILHGRRRNPSLYC
jgi:hypothetical protein